MSINELLNEIGITQEVKEVNGKYIVDIENSDEYAKVYSKLDKSPLVDLEEESVVTTIHSNLMLYMADEYDITLEANFDTDTYRLVIERV